MIKFGVLSIFYKIYLHIYVHILTLFSFIVHIYLHIYVHILTILVHINPSPVHDNALAHKSRTSRAAIRKCGFVELHLPPYNPELASSDYFPFRNLKKKFAWATISQWQCRQGSCTRVFWHAICFIFSEDSLSLQAKWTKCFIIIKGGGYIEIQWGEFHYQILFSCDPRGLQPKCSWVWFL